MLLKDIMSSRIESIGPGRTLGDAYERMQRRGIHHLVVTSRGQIVGMVTAGEVEARMAEGIARVEDAMSRRVPIGLPEMTIAQAARLMRNSSQSALPVFDGRRLVGIVTISDLLDVLGRRNRRSGRDRHRAAPLRER
jgi:acetoin utilization protein AcuB